MSKRKEKMDTETGEILVEELVVPSTDAVAVVAPLKVTRFTSNYRHDKARSVRFATYNLEPSLTQQSDAEDSDINVIVRKYVKGAGLPNVQKEPIYGDFSEEGMDYRTMVEKIAAADRAFQEVPADVRGRFGNDPARWMEFVNNPENLGELRKMGLAEPEPIPQPEAPPMKVVVVGDAPK